MRSTVKDQPVGTIKPSIGKGEINHASKDNQACQGNGSLLWRFPTILVFGAQFSPHKPSQSFSEGLSGATAT
jgi:hypothetical protein